MNKGKQSDCLHQREGVHPGDRLVQVDQQCVTGQFHSSVKLRKSQLIKTQLQNSTVLVSVAYLEELSGGGVSSLLINGEPALFSNVKN